MSKVFYDMGFLAKAEVTECSATNLIGEYLGQTGPKVQKVLENALGRVLFIDEAYRLAEGPYAKEAMDEIVDCLTKEKFFQKLVVILAGYDQDINRLMSQNPGLTSRFPDTVVFEPLKPIHSLGLLTELLQGRKDNLKKKGRQLDLSALESPSPDFKQLVLDHFETLRNTANWANARDVQTLGKAIFSNLVKSSAMTQQTVVVAENDIRSVLETMMSERSQRDRHGQLDSIFDPGMDKMHSSPLPRLPPKAPVTQFAQNTSHAERAEHPEVEISTTADEVKRDIGVTDAIWEQLQHDKLAAEQREEQYRRLIKEMSETRSKIDMCKQEEQAAKEGFPQAITPDLEQNAINEAKRLREEARIKHELERRAHEELLEGLARKRKAEEDARKKEAKAQQKLKTMGVCCMGFRWIKQSGGYRCAGGSHFVSDQELGI
jgi:hypothetical protein